MAAEALEQTGSTVVGFEDLSDREVYECRVWVFPDDGDFTAILPTLPGVASQGTSIHEAIENVREAFRGAIEDYSESGEDIPWLSEPDDAKTANTVEKWILINV